MQEQIDYINQKRGIAPKELDHKKRVNMDDIYSWKARIVSDIAKKRQQAEAQKNMDVNIQ